MNMHDRYRDLVAWDPTVFGQLGMRPEQLGLPADDERLWVVIDENVWLRPLFFDMTTGSHSEILRVRRGGVPGCHRHPSLVHGYVIKGSWRYLEHSWVARKGAYVLDRSVRSTRSRSMMPTRCRPSSSSTDPSSMSMTMIGSSTSRTIRGLSASAASISTLLVSGRTLSIR